ncbi:unnamed protein product, partial [Amoebophrya sp. A120]
TAAGDDNDSIKIFLIVNRSDTMVNDVGLSNTVVADIASGTPSPPQDNKLHGAPLGTSCSKDSDHVGGASRGGPPARPPSSSSKLLNSAGLSSPLGVVPSLPPGLEVEDGPGGRPLGAGAAASPATGGVVAESSINSLLAPKSDRSIDLTIAGGGAPNHENHPSGSASASCGVSNAESDATFKTAKSRRTSEEDGGAAVLTAAENNAAVAAGGSRDREGGHAGAALLRRPALCHGNQA